MKEEVVNKWQTVVGMNLDTLTSMNDLGLTLYLAKRLNEAAQLQLKLVEI